MIFLETEHYGKSYYWLKKILITYFWNYENLVDFAWSAGIDSSYMKNINVFSWQIFF